MSTVQQFAADIRDSLERLNAGSVVIFGEAFGGRVDNFHSIVSADASKSSNELEIGFDLGEVLRVWDPVGVELERGTMKIAGASRVRWEWVSYGLVDSPTNRLAIDYRVRDETLTIDTNAPWADPHREIPYTFQAAVEIVWF